MKLLPKIRERRMEAHLTQTELSQLSSINRTQINLIENGKRFPQPITLWRIAKACNCKVDDLYFFEE